jgi:uncharacterized RDD family membrane protein YckC
VSDDTTEPYGAPPEGQDQPPPGQYQPPAPYQPPPGGYQPPGQYQPPAPYQPPPGGYQPPPPPGGYSPPGGYPPPPPPGGGYPPPTGGYSGGYAPPPPYGGYGGAPGAYAPQVGAPLAGWGQRALGWLIDFGIFIILGFILHAVNAVVADLVGLISLAWAIWLAVQIGQTGQTPGMRVQGLKAISKDTGASVGTGKAVGRWLMHSVFFILCVIPGIVDYLFPLWDSEKQTLADKVVGSVVIVVPKQPFSLSPPKSQGY